MATLAFPVVQLVIRAKDETRSVKECSHADTEHTSAKAVCQIVVKTLRLRRCLSELVDHQSAYLASLTKTDFTRLATHELEQAASEIESLLEDERQIVNNAAELGLELRIWWQASLKVLSAQMEHLDSIAESLRLECDPEASFLLSVAALQVA